MSVSAPDLFDAHFAHAEAARDQADRDLYPLRLLDITRKVRAAVPHATALLVDTSTRWEDPIGPAVTAVRSTATWSATEPPTWLRDWRGPQGIDWEGVIETVEHHLTNALGLGEPEHLGWHAEGDQWRLDLLDPLAVAALTTLQQCVFAPDRSSESRWVHLDFFSDDQVGAKYFALRNCPACEGGGLVEAKPRLWHGGDTTNCTCVRRLTA